MHRNKGFTLMELMIVVAIVAILASVAVPSYMEHVRKARRIEATGTLTQVAAAMERFLLANNAYPANIGVLVNGGGGLTAVGGHGLKELSGNFYTENNHYYITRKPDDAEGRGWRLQATAATKAAKQDTDCYYFNIYQNGEMRVQKLGQSGFLSGAAAQACLPN